MSVHYTIRQLFNLLAQCRLLGDGSGSFVDVSTDTRTIRSGQLFVALKGETFDGNLKVAQAIENGAAAVVMDDENLAQLLRAQLDSANRASTNQKRVSILLVPNSLVALGRIAQTWRCEFKLPLIAVVGSNGKTTVKEMIASILHVHFGPAAFATQGNLNNEIGLPQTLFRLNDSVKAAAIEMGMNHPGEISRLAAIANASVAVITNAQREHQEFMKTVQAVALENGSAISALAASGTAVFPADDTFSGLWRDLAGARHSITFGLQKHDSSSISVWALPTASPDRFDIHFQDSTYEVKLAIAGRHNVRNALAASAAALAIGIDWKSIIQGLERFRPVKGRLVAHTLGSVGLIDDSYNANPDSVLAAIALLAEQPEPRCLVLGDMGEVGEQGPQFHAEVAQAIL